MAEISTQSYDLRDFTRIDLRGAGDIQLTQGQGFQIEVTAEDHIHEILRLEIEEESLVIGFEKGLKQIKTTGKIVYKITMPLIAGIRISGGGSVTCERIAGKSFVLDLPGGAKAAIDSIAVVDYHLRIPGGAKIRTKSLQAANAFIEIPGSANLSIESLEADKLTITMQGTGNLDLAGRVVAQSVDIAGAGNISAAHLQSEHASVRNNGTGNITLWVQHDLDVIVGGMSNISYYGNPRLKKSISGFGKVRQIGDAPMVKA